MVKYNIEKNYCNLFVALERIYSEINSSNFEVANCYLKTKNLRVSWNGAYLYDDTKPFVAKCGHDFKSF